MRAHSLRLWLPALFILICASSAHADAIQHALQVRVDPAAHRLEVQDRVSLPKAAPDTLVLRLHAGLGPRLLGEGATLTPLREPADSDGPIPLETYRVVLEPGVRGFVLSYEGEIHHPVTDQGEEYARSFRVSPGLIGPEGVLLGGSSHWWPQIGGFPMLGFEMTVSLPEGWRSVSQGQRTERSEQNGRVQETWQEASPQEEIYLVAARFTEYRRAGGGVEAVVFLREPDEALARRYLEVTRRTLQMYDRLIGPYPYTKFALVENFWETGYGMPSFTLLGPRVIRLPFIPYTSYPHEILHNWWGNGVYVDFDSGNWSEGLTSYRACHLVKEQRGEGAEYRRAALQKYLSYVGRAEDFPLSAFRGRHGETSQAVGYNKALMFFHMLRRRLGDAAFLEGLRLFEARHRFKRAGFADLRAAFESVSGLELESEFEQWVSRVGAPALEVTDVRVERNAEGYRLKGALRRPAAELVRNAG